MNPETSETSTTDQSETLIRLDERIKALDGMDKRVSRLNNYLQICGVVLLVLGIGGGFLVSRFLDAQRKIGELSEQVAGAQLKLSGQLTQAQKAFDDHVAKNPIVATLQSRLIGLETAFAPVDITPDGGKVSIKYTNPVGPEKNVTGTITCPEGTYMYGIRFQRNEGNYHGIIHSVEPLYRAFRKKQL